jgi:DNA-binding NarL/FixJ family response regulator
VGSPPPDHDALLRRARAAHREHRYDAAYADLRAAADLAPLDVADLHLLADAAWWLGLMSECLRLTEAAHRDFLGSGHVDRAAAHALDMAGMLAMRGEPALASGWLGRARRLLEGVPTGPTHGLLWYVDLSLALAESRLDEVAVLADDLRRLGDEHEDENLVALGYLGSGLAALRGGRVPEAFALLEESMLRVVGGGVSPEWQGHIYCTIVSACLDVADLNRARHWCAAADRWLEDFTEAVMFTGVCRAHEVQLLVAEGAWDAAEEKADTVVRELRELNVEATAEAEYQRGDCLRLRGDLAGAEACFQRAAELGRDPQPGRALLLWERGHLDRAWAEVTDALGRGAGEPFRCARLLRAQVEIAAASGRSDAATDAARRLRALADDFGTPGFVAWADHAAGVVASATGRPADARTDLTRAAAGYRRMRAWYDVAGAEALLADAYRLLGDAAGEREHREAAEATYRRLGTADPGETCQASMPGGLTAREAEVLGLVATGLGNREAAGVLSISEATVRRHLANIYLKLGVGSRTAAAAWAHEHGLVAPPPMSPAGRAGLSWRGARDPRAATTRRTKRETSWPHPP